MKYDVFISYSREDLSLVEPLVKDIEKRGKEASPKEQSSIPVLQLINECMARGIKFLPIDIEKSDAYAFVPEGDSAIRMPFSILPFARLKLIPSLLIEFLWERSTRIEGSSKSKRCSFTGAAESVTSVPL